MRIKSGMEDDWAKTVENNDDPYGKAGVGFARRWAETMEKRLDAGEKLEDIAEPTSHEADTEGITGFMYGCAVSVLSACWEHGEDLRRWHNIDTQIGSEGEKANESGGCLNPAILSVGKK